MEDIVLYYTISFIFLYSINKLLQNLNIMYNININNKTLKTVITEATLPANFVPLIFIYVQIHKIDEQNKKPIIGELVKLVITSPK